MISFDYKNPTRLIFGKDSIKKVESILKELDVHSVMMVSGKSAARLGILDEIKNACDKNNIHFVHCDQVVANPKIELVRELISLGRKEKTDFIIAVGGGSPIDTAKSIAMGIPYDGDVWDFFEGKATPKSAVSIGAISTIPASGSESSNATIMNNGLYKKGYEDDMLIPKFAILDPSYTLTLPANQTSAGCADIMSHLLERYFTTTENTDVTDYLIVGAMKALIKNSVIVVDDPQNFAARSEIQLLATIAHNGWLDLGRQTDWASHRIEHELSGQYNITHGEGMAVVLIAYIKYMAERLPKKMADLANLLFDIDYNGHSEKEMALLLAEKLKEFFKKLNLKTTLTEFGIGKDHFEEMAMRATNNDTSTFGHYIPLHKKEFIEILEMAL
ncbi:MAG: iron-containing alcohol dehydrogenase [Lachnospiraceae bacterium]|nr:iron-containing alcohol dehydrogenase [Lachnospiraceae bacterium]